MTKTDIRFAITRGYVQIPFKKLRKDGSVEKEGKGGFVEDWEHGHIWAFIDLENNSILKLNFDLQKLLKNVPKMIEEAKKK